MSVIAEPASLPGLNLASNTSKIRMGELYTDTVAFACPLRENVFKGISIVEALRNLMAYEAR